MGWWSEQSIGAFFRSSLDNIRSSPLAWLWLLLAYLIRPLLLVPISILTLATGLFFGVGWGLLYANIAILISTIMAYYIGWYFGDALPTLPPKWQERISTNTFSATFVSRMIALPGDLVNYAAGMLRIDLRPFLLATLLGGSPGLVVGLLAGASLETSLQEGAFSIKGWYLLLAAIVALIMMAVAWLLRRQGYDKAR